MSIDSYFRKLPEMPRKKNQDNSEEQVLEANANREQQANISEERGEIDASMRACIRETMAEMTTNVTKALDIKLTPVLELLKVQGERLDAHEARLNESERRISTLEDAADPARIRIASLEKSVLFLTDRIDDLENRGRRRNVRILNLSEEAEGTNPTLFFERWLPEVLRIKTKDGRIKLDRAHRVTGFKPSPTQKPRPVIVRFHNYQDKQRVMNASWNMGRNGQAVIHDGATVMFFPDMSAALARKRKGYGVVKKRLRTLGAVYRQIYPALLKVTYRGSSKVFSSPEEVQHFIDSLELPVTSGE